MSILLNDNLNISASKPVDSRYGPYSSIEAALAAVPSFQRYQGLIIAVNDGNLVEYWFKAGILDENLEEKASSGAGGGYTGSAGDIGYTGSSGDIGYTGSKGADGTSVQILGSTSTYSTLPSDYLGNIGDGYITTDNGHLNIWVGSSWSDVGSISGPQGYTGSAGSSGDIGYTGSVGIDGYTGSSGDIGYTGSAGPGADQDLNTTSSVTFANVTLAASGVITFADGSIQRSKSPQMYTNADAEAGLTIDDLLPGDFYYDDTTESIFIMVDTGYGYNNLLDLTVRAA